MTLAQFCVGALVLLPLLSAAVSALLPHTARRVLGPATGVGIVALTVPVAWTVTEGQVVEFALGGYESPLGIMLRADGLSVLFLCVAGLVGLAVTCYAALVPKATGQRLTRHGWQDAAPGYWPLWLGCWSGLNAVFVSGDLFNTYVGLELVALSAVGLVALGGRASWRAALRYLFVSVLGSLLFLVGVGLIVSATGTLDIGQAARVIADQPESHPAAVLALVLLTVGLCLKVALVPLHSWLIPAHAGAPSAVSPVLSALVIKAALFVLLRCWLWLVAPGIFPAGGPDSAGAMLPPQTIMVALSWLLGGLGALALVVGSVMALRQTHLKRLIAYSTVAQAGYWFLFFPMAVAPAANDPADRGVTAWAEDAVLAGALGGTLGLALGHGIAKAALFLAAGFLKDLYGTDEIRALRGSIRQHPTLIMAMGLAAVGLAGLPVSLAFSGKWQLASAAVASGHYWILVAVVAGTLFSVAYLLKILGPLLSEDNASDDHESSPTLPEARPGALPWAAQLAPFALGTLTVLTGFTGAWSAGVLEVGAPW